MRTIKRSIVWLICLVMLLGMLPTISFAEDTEEGLVLHYDFKSLQNGTIVEDISGNGKAAEVMPRASGVEIQEVEIYGSPKTAIVIAGGSPSTGHNYVELPVGVLNDLESVTISCWVYVNRTVSYGRIWDFGSNTTSYMYLLDAGANAGHEGYTAAMTNSGWSNEIGPVKGTNLATRTWKLTTVTFDGETRTLSLYEDGELIDSATTSSNLSILEGSTQNWIGYGQFKDDLFNGMIADFRIYNYAMSDAEVAQLFDIPDDDRVQRDYNSLSLGNTSNLEQNLNLPVTGAAGSSIEWTSSDEGVITAQGVITRPAPGEPNGAATLTARIFYGEAEMEKTFDVTVLARPTNEDRVSIDAAAINLGSLDGVTSNLTLPVKGAKGSDITWTSSDPAHLSDTGVVTRPVGEPVTVTLTALVSYEDASTTREFRVTILPVYEKLDAVKAEPVAVITEVGIAPALPAVVLTTFEDGSKRMVKVTWPTNLSGSNYAEVGEQTVTGALVDFDVSVTATVTVVEEVQTPAAAASLLDLSSVSLDGDDSIYAQNYGRAKEYLKVMDADRMLYNFRRTFGQDTNGAGALSGWDEPTGLLRGHSTGHFMSALAEAYASTGDEAYKEKLDYVIDAMRELQLLSQGKASEFVTACTPSDAAQSKWSTDPSTWGEGFISAYSPDQFALLEQYTPYATIWAPYYTMHKLLAGFLDSYVYAGNETGLQIATDLGLWVYDRLSACTPEQRTRMWSMYIAGEYGGMNEVLARLYEITGDERLLTASRMFDNTTFFDGLAEGRDTIQNRHANQHIPQIVGAIHEYAATGDPYYYNVARNFWEMATARYAYSIGGVGTGESFKAPYAQGVNINGNSSRGENCETCAAYNLLKLTRDLYIYDPDNAAYMDYYERTVLNQIAASQSHDSTASTHNGCTYMLPIDPGQRRSYDSDYGGFTCCNGTGMENHVIYQIAAYAKTDDTIYVNLYMPSTAQWTEKNVTVKQETQFPSEDVKLTVTGSGSFKMKLRVPYWATAGYEVKVNGETVCTAPTPSSYVELDREWADGDTVDIHMPYTLYLDKTPDRVSGSVVASLMYGPMVMVARDTNSRYTAMNWYTLNLNDTNLDAAVSIEEPAGTGSVPHLVAEGLDFYPMYDAYNYRYHAYVKLMDAQSVLNPEYLQAAVDKVAGDDAPVEANFSAEDWQMFQDALGAAQALLEKVPEVTQIELYDAQIALEEALSKAHEPELDQTALEAAIRAAEAVDKDQYTPESVKALDDAFSAAKAVQAKEDATQAEVDEAAKAVNDAIAALEARPVEPEVSKEALNKAIEEAEKVEKDKYTEASVKVLEEAVAAAKVVQAKEDATQAEVDEAAKTLNDAIAVLEVRPVEPEVSKEALNKAIEEAEKVEKDKYTEASVKALEEAVSAAKAVQAKEDAAQAEVDEAVKAVNDAVTALKEKPEEPPFRFDDVKDEGKFFFEPVYWAFNASPQITNGVDATHFGPDNPCTRGHVVTFLWRAAGCPEPEDAQTSFTDLKPGAFYEKAVAWAVETGITNGVSPTAFAPNDTCTRGQIVTFLWRFRGKQEPKSTDTPFTDLKPGAFYEKAVAWAVELGVTKGMTESTFVPDGTCTRGQVVTFLYRAIEE